jgi:cytochrome b involved in lipid metabolism
MRFRARFVFFALISTLALSPAAHAKAPVPGSKCTKLKITQIYQGKKFTCIKSGKKLIWSKGVLIKVALTPTPTPTPTLTPTPTPTPTKSGYTMDQVRTHNTNSSCWTVIDGYVYDLTQWIFAHPGGAGTIRALCGVDGTNSFNGQHANQSSPAQRLNSYLLGPLTK